MALWEYVVQIHRAVDVQALTLFYGVVGSALCFVALQIVRNRRLSKRLRQMEAELNTRFDEKTAPALTRLSAVEDDVRETHRDAEAFRRRVDQVESRIPNLYDRMEEFRNTLARIFQNELGAVLGSFDSSVGAVLEHMKSDLHMGITRIETIEEMVNARHQAGKALLSGEETTSELPEAEDSDEETIDAELLETEQKDDLDVWLAEEEEPEETAESTIELESEEEVKAEGDEDQDYRSRAA